MANIDTLNVDGTNYSLFDSSAFHNLVDGTNTGSVKSVLSTKSDGDYSFAEGYNTEASGAYSHAEGHGTTASGNFSHAEGYLTTASGRYSHAEGYSTTASSYYSHAQGYCTTASGYFSHAEGLYTTAYADASYACGKYSTTDSSLFKVGNGTSTSNRSDAFRVYGSSIYSSSEMNWPIGDYEYEFLASDKTIKTSTATNVCSITLGPGNWFIVCGVRFSSNSSGIRRVNLTTASADSDDQFQCSPVSGATTQINFTRVASPSEETTYYLNAYQTSGSSLTLPAGDENQLNYITAVKLF